VQAYDCTASYTFVLAPWLPLHPAPTTGLPRVQAQVPFDEDTTQYIANLDPDKDLALLRERGVPVRPQCARIFKAANMVLKKCASCGLSPKHASDIMERHTMRKSIMEKMHKCVAHAGPLAEACSCLMLAVMKTALVSCLSRRPLTH
jgi:hypothetical protein